MIVYVNNKEVEIIPGMKVRHALISAGILKKGIYIKSMKDKWGNEIGIDGELSEGDNIFVELELI